MPTRHQLALTITPPAPRRPMRRVRRPFAPSTASDGYSLPTGFADGLTAALVGYRNRDAAMALAAFLARMWSAPRRLRLGFPIDRRALARCATLGLTEARIRGALATLEGIGFIRRMHVPGRTHQVSERGELHRKPTVFRFGPEAMEAFETANARAARARQRRSPTKAITAPFPVPRLPTALPNGVARVTSSPKGTGRPKGAMIMGEQRSTIGLPPPVPRMMPDPSDLDAALARLAAARCARVIGGRP